MSQKADAIKAFIDDSYDVLEKAILKDCDADLERIGNDIIAYLTTKNKNVRDSALNSLYEAFDPIPTIGIKLYPSGFGSIYLGLEGCPIVRNNICSLPYKDFNDSAFKYILPANSFIF